MSRRPIVSIAIFCFLVTFGAWAQVRPGAWAQSSVLSGAGGRDLAVARVVHGVLGYTRWPARPASIRLCVAGNAEHAGRLGGSPPEVGGPVAVRRFSDAGAVRPADCDAVLLGEMPNAGRAALLARMRGQPVVTIDDNDDACRAGAMFCLTFVPEGLALQMNIDAVSRGTVRVDPRVLRLSAPGGARR